MSLTEEQIAKMMTKAKALDCLGIADARALAAEVRRLREENEALQTGHGVYQRGCQRAREETRIVKAALAEAQALFLSKSEECGKLHADLRIEQDKHETTKAVLARAVGHVAAMIDRCDAYGIQSKQVGEARAFVAEQDGK